MTTRAARIVIQDLPPLETLSPEELAAVFGAGIPNRVRLGMELLETRELMATASLSNGLLRVEGTPNPDAITITRSVQGTPAVDSIRIDGIGSFPTAQVQRIAVEGGAGNDVVTLNYTSTNVLPVIDFDLGAGDDRIIGPTGTTVLGAGTEVANKAVFAGGKVFDQLPDGTLWEHDATTGARKKVLVQTVQAWVVAGNKLFAHTADGYFHQRAVSGGDWSPFSTYPDGSKQKVTHTEVHDRYFVFHEAGGRVRALDLTQGVVTSGLGDATEFAATDKVLYAWRADGSVWARNLDGTGEKSIDTRATGLVRAGAYWVFVGDTGRVRALDLSQNKVTSGLGGAGTDVGRVTEFAVVGGTLYAWGGGGTAVRARNLDGTGETVIDASATGLVRAGAYWVFVGDTGRVRALDLAQNRVTSGIADGTEFYLTDTGVMYVWCADGYLRSRELDGDNERLGVKVEPPQIHGHYLVYKEAEGSLRVRDLATDTITVSRGSADWKVRDAWVAAGTKVYFWCTDGALRIQNLDGTGFNVGNKEGPNNAYQDVVSAERVGNYLVYRETDGSLRARDLATDTITVAFEKVVVYRVENTQTVSAVTTEGKVLKKGLSGGTTTTITDARAVAVELWTYNWDGRTTAFNSFTAARAGAVLMAYSWSDRVAVIDHLTDERAGAILMACSWDDCIAVIGHLTDERAGAILLAFDATLFSEAVERLGPNRASQILIATDMAGIYTVGSTLLIVGNEFNNRTRVSREGANLLFGIGWTVHHSGGLQSSEHMVAILPYGALTITAISFYGKDGDDEFENLTSIPVAAYGGAGNDTLISRTGRDTIRGEGGSDRITLAVDLGRQLSTVSESQLPHSEAIGDIITLTVSLGDALSRALGNFYQYFTPRLRPITELLGRNLVEIEELGVEKTVRDAAEAIPALKKLIGVYDDLMALNQFATRLTVDTRWLDAGSFRVTADGVVVEGTPLNPFAALVQTNAVKALADMGLTFPIMTNTARLAGIALGDVADLVAYDFDLARFMGAGVLSVTGPITEGVYFVGPVPVQYWVNWGGSVNFLVRAGLDTRGIAAGRPEEGLYFTNFTLTLTGSIMVGTGWKTDSEVAQAIQQLSPGISGIQINKGMLGVEGTLSVTHSWILNDVSGKVYLFGPSDFTPDLRVERVLEGRLALHASVGVKATGWASSLIGTANDVLEDAAEAFTDVVYTFTNWLGNITGTETRSERKPEWLIPKELKWGTGPEGIELEKWSTQLSTIEVL